jgi:uncharacterized protein YdcH (DUF465 family)
MEIYNEELKARLMATDEHFRSLVEKHAQFHHELEALEARGHLSPAEEAEEHRLKKQKLRIKDEMIAIMSRHRTQVA